MLLMLPMLLGWRVQAMRASHQVQSVYLSMYACILCLSVDLVIMVCSPITYRNNCCEVDG